MILPAVGKVIEALAPVPTLGEPVGLKLQLYEKAGTPKVLVVEAVLVPC